MKLHGLSEIQDVSVANGESFYHLGLLTMKNVLLDIFQGVTDQNEFMTKRGVNLADHCKKKKSCMITHALFVDQRADLKDFGESMQGINLLVPHGYQKTFSDDEIDFLPDRSVVTVANSREVEDKIYKVFVMIDSSAEARGENFVSHDRVDSEFAHESTHLIVRRFFDVYPKKILILMSMNHVVKYTVFLFV